MADNQFDKINELMGRGKTSGDESSIRELIESESDEMFKLMNDIQSLCNGHTLFTGTTACAVACALVLKQSDGDEEDNLKMLSTLYMVQKDIVKMDSLMER